MIGLKLYYHRFWRSYWRGKEDHLWYKMRHAGWKARRHALRIKELMNNES